jgi:hypothetical protein
MARLARVELLAADEVVHVMNRVVRRCFLLGDDAVTGENCDHRKQWLEGELQKLAGAMGIDLLGFSILSNHFHLILRSLPDAVALWDDTEVARRWLLACPRQKKEDGRGSQSDPRGAGRDAGGQRSHGGTAARIEAERARAGSASDAEKRGLPTDDRPMAETPATTWCELVSNLGRLSWVHVAVRPPLHLFS